MYRTINKIFHAVVLCIIIIHVSICSLFFQGASFWAYITYACEASFIIILFQFLLSGKRIDKFELFGLAYLLFLLLVSVFTNLSSDNIVALFGRFIEIALLVMLFHLNKKSLIFLLVTGTIVFSIGVYCNFLFLLQFPDGIPNFDGDNYYILGTNYNQFGPKILLAIALNILLLNRSKFAWCNFLALSFFGVYSLIIVGSMTSLVSIVIFLISLGVSLAFNGRLNRLIIFSTLMLVIIFEVFIVFLGDSISNVTTNDFLNFIGKDSTFTGRTQLWNYSGDYFLDSPLFGHGFVTPNDYGNSKAFHGITRNSHNYIYNVLHKGGILLFLLLFLLVKCGYNAIKRNSKKNDAFCILMTAVTFMVMCLFEVYDSFYVFFILTLMFYYPMFCLKKYENCICNNTYVQK